MENPKVVNRGLVFFAVLLGAISVVASLHLNIFFPVALFLVFWAILATISLINAVVFGPIILLIGQLFSDRPKSRKNGKTP